MSNVKVYKSEHAYAAHVSTSADSEVYELGIAKCPGEASDFYLDFIGNPILRMLANERPDSNHIPDSHYKISVEVRNDVIEASRCPVQIVCQEMTFAVEDLYTAMEGGGFSV